MNLNDYRRRHDQTATLAAVVVAGFGCAGAMLPVVEHAITLALFGGAGLAVVISAVRTALRVLRERRERREDRADLLAGAVWRAEHLPHLVAPTTAGCTTGQVSVGAAGWGMS
jgi:Kef-type K+ transport system membrane component KefB